MSKQGFSWVNTNKISFNHISSFNRLLIYTRINPSRDKKMKTSTVTRMTPKYTLYKTRWLFMANVVSLNMICTLILVSFSPVATLVTNYYEISGDRIDTLTLVAFGINVVGMLAAIYAIGR